MTALRQDPSTSATQAAPVAALGSLLIVDDDAPMLTRLARAMEKRGFTVATARPRRTMR
jgi:ActR/RegA family two-component response regulator